MMMMMMMMGEGRSRKKGPRRKVYGLTHLNVARASDHHAGKTECGDGQCHPPMQLAVRAGALFAFETGATRPFHIKTVCVCVLSVCACVCMCVCVCVV
jgi:hypothetical protein